MSRIYDWEQEEVFEGYDPVDDGFAYPMELDQPEDCYCTQDPRQPEQAIICERCYGLLLSESPDA